MDMGVIDGCRKGGIVSICVNIEVSMLRNLIPIFTSKTD